MTQAIGRRIAARCHVRSSSVTQSRTSSTAPPPRAVGPDHLPEHGAAVTAGPSQGVRRNWGAGLGKAGVGEPSCRPRPGPADSAPSRTALRALSSDHRVRRGQCQAAPRFASGNEGGR